MDKMVTVSMIYDCIDALAPFSTALSYDNVGLLVGSKDTQVRRVLISLDITPAVVNEAQRTDCQLIVSHHPVIFNPLRKLEPDSAPYLLAQAGIGALCAHTNLDMAQQGVNTALAQALGLQHVQPLVLQEGLPLVLAGRLPGENGSSAAEFAGLVKKALGCDGVRYVPGARRIQTVALCSGAGGEFAQQAAALGADAFVTGEIKHHELLAAAQAGMTVVDAGHYATERVVLPFLCNYLARRFPEVTFALSQRQEDVTRYLV